MTLMKSVKKVVVALVIVLGLGLVLPGGALMAETAKEKIEQGAGAMNKDESGNDITTKTLDQTTLDIINTVLFVAGIVATGFLVYGGVQYLTSAGAAEKVKTAKNTIMYAIIGLIVCILAYAIVKFVVERIS
jgi:ABC-type Fe3+ transport system permease subunit